jgi:hypothetical protein
MEAFAATLRTAIAAPLARPLVSFWQILVESTRRHRALTMIVLVYWTACQAAGALVGGSAVVETTPFAIEFVMLVATLVGAALIYTILRVMVVVRPEGSLYAAIWQELRADFTLDRLANALVPILLAPLFFSTFGSFKRLIPYVNPFGWDETFMRWDQALHGGAAPWELLQPLLGSPLVTSGVNFFYNLWLFVMFFTFIWQMLTLKRQAVRMQFLLSFVSCWIVVGTIAASYLSSAGPCFFGRITGLADPYAPLMTYLHAAAEHVPVWSLNVQEMLWENYQSRGTMLGGGISAMPSMHVASSVLLALLGWRTGRWFGIAYTAFAAVIMIGSVHLGWHYAIDGYLGTVLAMAIWYAIGWATRRHGTA